MASKSNYVNPEEASFDPATPSDEELIYLYLLPKLQGQDSRIKDFIGEVDFTAFEPWQLRREAKFRSNDRIWLFFCMDWAGNMARKTKEGIWTRNYGWEKEIAAEYNGEKVRLGEKQIFVYCVNESPVGKKKRTNWVMEEFSIDRRYAIANNISHKPNFVIRRLKKTINNRVYNPPDDEGEPSRGIDNSGNGNPRAPPDTNPVEVRAAEVRPNNLEVQGTGLLPQSRAAAPHDMGQIADELFADSLIVDQSENIP